MKTSATTDPGPSPAQGSQAWGGAGFLARHKPGLETRPCPRTPSWAKAGPSGCTFIVTLVKSLHLLGLNHPLWGLAGGSWGSSQYCLQLDMKPRAEPQLTPMPGKGKTSQKKGAGCAAVLAAWHIAGFPHPCTHVSPPSPPDTTLDSCTDPQESLN